MGRGAAANGCAWIKEYRIGHWETETRKGQCVVIVVAVSGLAKLERRHAADGGYFSGNHRHSVTQQWQFDTGKDNASEAATTGGSQRLSKRRGDKKLRT